MLKISRKADYGLLLLSVLAKAGEGKVFSLRKLAKKRQMPYKFLSQIAPILVTHGILGSKEGVGGGYFLARDPKSISVGKVLEILEGPFVPVSCMREGCVCEPGCLQKNAMEKITRTLKKTMQKFTLADLVGK